MPKLPDQPLLKQMFADAEAAYGEERIPEGRGGHIYVDRTLYRIKDIKAPVQGELAFGFSINEAELAILGQWLDVVSFSVKGLRTTTLAPITAWKRLRRLRLWWVQKLEDLSPLAEMQGLDMLVLSDIKRARDLSPIAKLTGLRACVVEGGIWSDQTVETLEPLTALPNLQELNLSTLKVAQDGLRPLARCKALQSLMLPYNFQTEDYAYLAARRPDLTCNALRARVRLSSPGAGKDTMIVGKRKPMLHSQKDAARIAKYEAAFDAMVAAFRAENS